MSKHLPFSLNLFNQFIMSRDRIINIVGALTVMFAPTILVIIVWIATFGSFELATAFQAQIFEDGVPTGRWRAEEAYMAFSGLAAIVGLCMLFAAICVDSE